MFFFWPRCLWLKNQNTFSKVFAFRIPSFAYSSDKDPYFRKGCCTFSGTLWVAFSNLELFLIFHEQPKLKISGAKTGKLSKITQTCYFCKNFSPANKEEKILKLAKQLHVPTERRLSSLAPWQNVADVNTHLCYLKYILWESSYMRSCLPSCIHSKTQLCYWKQSSCPWSKCYSLCKTLQLSLHSRQN